MAKNPLHTKLCDMLGIEFPIIAFTHCKDVVAAVVNAGGFAVLGEAMHTPDEIAADIKWIREPRRPRSRSASTSCCPPRRRRPTRSRSCSPASPRSSGASRRASRRSTTSRSPRAAGAAPVGRPQPGHRAQAARRHPRGARAGVHVRPRQPGLHPRSGARARHEGVRPGRQGAAGEARDRGRRRRRSIAQGYDAAGHTGPIGTFSIVPEVVAIAGDVPVIAAGGVTTGRHLAAVALPRRRRRVDRHALARLARVRLRHDHQGEAHRRHLRRHRVLEERLGLPDARDAAARGPRSGRSPRRRACSNSPYQMLLSSDYIQAANDHRRADLMFEAAGQGVAFVDAMKPARQIVADLVEEALSVFEELTGESADAAASAQVVRRCGTNRSLRAQDSTRPSPAGARSATAAASIAGTRYATREEFAGTLTGDYVDHGDPPWRWYLMTTSREDPTATPATRCGAKPATSSSRTSERGHDAPNRRLRQGGPRSRRGQQLRARGQARDRRGRPHAHPDVHPAPDERLRRAGDRGRARLRDAGRRVHDHRRLRRRRPGRDPEARGGARRRRDRRDPARRRGAPTITASQPCSRRTSARRGGADLVLCGRQASDDDQGVVPALIGERLGAPVVTVARSVEIADAARPTVRVVRVTPDGDETVLVDAPVVVTISNELGPPRYPTMAGRMAARKKKRRARRQPSSACSRRICSHASRWRASSCRP